MFCDGSIEMLVDKLDIVSRIWFLCLDINVCIMNEIISMKGLFILDSIMSCTLCIVKDMSD